MEAIRLNKRSGLTRDIRYLASDLLGKCKKRAVKHKATVTIDYKWVHDRLLVGACEITGLPLEFKSRGTGRVHNRAPSIDRIDSGNRNYTPENSRLVCAQVNVALGPWNSSESLPVLRALVATMEQRSHLASNEFENLDVVDDLSFRYT